MRLTKIFNLDKNIIQIYNNKNIKFFYKNFINKFLKCSQSIKKLKKYNLKFKMVISNLKICFSSINFENLCL